MALEAQKQSQVSTTIQASPIEQTKQTQTQRTDPFAGPVSATSKEFAKYEGFQTRVKELMMMEYAGNEEIAAIYRELYKEAKEEHMPLKTDLSMSGMQKVKMGFLRQI